MKPFVSILLLLPGLSVAQPDSLAPQRSVISSRPPADSLKPIEFREIPYQYTSSSTSTYGGRQHTSYSTHTGIHRIYTYDGIDVVDPEKTLWPTLLKVNDPDVARLRQEYSTIRENRATAMTIGTLLMVPGLIMMGVGAVQGREYRDLVAKQNAAYYSLPTTTYVTKTCNNWSGGPNGTGSYQWICLSDPTISYTGVNSTPPFTTTVPVTHTSAPAPVTVSDGKGLMIAGLVSMLVGTIVFCSAQGDGPGTFLRAVQYYNRALKQPVSWQLLPYSSFGTAGPSIVVRF